MLAYRDNPPFYTTPLNQVIPLSEHPQLSDLRAALEHNEQKLHDLLSVYFIDRMKNIEGGDPPEVTGDLAPMTFSEAICLLYLMDMLEHHMMKPIVLKRMDELLELCPLNRAYTFAWGPGSIIADKLVLRTGESVKDAMYKSYNTRWENGSLDGDEVAAIFETMLYDPMEM